MKRFVLENEGNDGPSKRGNPVLSRIKVEILVNVAVGYKDQEIADKLCISPHTVNTHL